LQQWQCWGRQHGRPSGGDVAQHLSDVVLVALRVTVEAGERQGLCLACPGFFGREALRMCAQPSADPPRARPPPHRRLSGTEPQHGSSLASVYAPTDKRYRAILSRPAQIKAGRLKRHRLTRIFCHLVDIANRAFV